MHRITGQIQNYAWGVPGGLTTWHKSSEADTHLPQAELWFGAHPNGASPLVDDPSKTLRDVVDPDEVPILVKLLAASRPLSIQVHPPVDQAEAQFAAANADPSIPKLLSDPFAKTEMLIALQPFSILQGMRDPELAAAILRQVGGSAIEAAAQLDDGHPKAAIRLLLGLSEEELLALGKSLPSSGAVAGLPPSAVAALAMVVRDFPGDPGILVAALLDQRTLAEGEAVYVPAGVVHAYVRGTGVEVMTSSDNVLRLGLTPKTVAVEEALAALNPELQPAPLEPAATAIPGGGTLRSFSPEGAPFTVDWVNGGTYTSPTSRYRLVLAVSGSASVSTGNAREIIKTGQAVAVLASERDVEIEATGSVFVARQAE